jgi:hypothetical protein
LCSGADGVIDVVPIDTVKRLCFVSFCGLRFSPPLLALGGLLVAGPGLVRGATFSNATPVNLPVGAPASPYPSPIAVSQITGTVTRVAVTLNNLSHVFPDDLDVLLVGPGGQKVMLMSDAGGGNAVNNINLTFAHGSGATLPDAGQITSGTFEPTDYQAGESLPGPAPPGPYETDLTVFNGANPNGTWQLFTHDDATFNGGGSIGGGWRLDLDVASPPIITTHPQSQTVPPGSTVSFGVSVTGTPPFGFQWLRNGQVLVPFGQGAPTLTISNVQAANAGTYAALVTNSVNRTGVLSSNAELNVLGPLTLVATPQNQTVDAGGTVMFQVIAAGTPPIFYQWRLNGALLQGQTNSTLTLSNVQAISGGSFSVTVFAEGEAVTTAPATLVVLAATEPPPTDPFSNRPRLQGFQGIMQGDSSRAGSERDEPVFPGGGKTVWCEWSAPADGIMTLTAQGSGFDTLLGVFTGTVLSNLTLLAKDDDQGGYYTSHLQFNAQEGASYQIMLDGFDYEGIGGKFTLSWLLQETKDLVPVFVSPPQSVAVLPGSNATFQVIAEPPDVSYQWLFDGIPIPGATGKVHMVTAATSAAVGFYSVRLMSSSGLTRESPLVDLQVGTTPGAVMQYKYQNVSEPSANGNRSGAGFISIGIGVTDYLQAAITNSGGLLTPCNSVSTKYRYRGLEATNNGVIFVTTEGSEILTRLAVYLEPIIANPVPLDCDTSSAMALQPAQLLFNATHGVKYMVVAEAYQATGDIDLTSTMGIAPPIPQLPDFCLIPPGGGIQLTMPATNWVPVPDCQWRLNGQDIPGATNTTLLLTNFSLIQTGAYSVVMSNFAGGATNTVAHLDLAGPLVLGHMLTTNNGNVGFVISASNAAPLLLQTTTNLDPNVPWVPLFTNQEFCLTFFFTNFNPLADPRRFFRAILWSPSGP